MYGNENGEKGLFLHRRILSVRQGRNYALKQYFRVLIHCTAKQLVTRGSDYADWIASNS